MSENEKLIEAINGHLKKLSADKLRIVLLMIYEFLKVPNSSKE